MRLAPRAGWLLAAVAAWTVGCGREPAARSSAAGMDPDDYDRWRMPERVIGALDLGPGQSVADIGAGRGYFTFRMAEAVGPSGRVVATDIDPQPLAEIARGVAAHPGVAAIETRHVAADDPGLELGRYDRVLLAQVDHLLADRSAYLARLRGALAPSARIAVSNRIPHRTALIAAAERAGYRVRSEVGDIPGQFVVVLEVDPVRSLGLALALGAVALCGDDGGGNPDRLYLALLDNELTVQLVDQEPEPF